MLWRESSFICQTISLSFELTSIPKTSSISIVIGIIPVRPTKSPPERSRARKNRERRFPGTYRYLYIHPAYFCSSKGQFLGQERLFCCALSPRLPYRQRAPKLRRSQKTADFVADKNSGVDRNCAR